MSSDLFQVKFFTLSSSMYELDLAEKAAGCLDRLSEESLCSRYKVTADDLPGSKMFASPSLTTRSSCKD